MIHKPGSMSITIAVVNAGISMLDLIPYLNRHLNGEWGELDPADAEIQNLAIQAKNIQFGTVFMSVWMIKDQRIWIVTNYGYSTTILTPEDY